MGAASIRTSRCSDRSRLRGRSVHRPPAPFLVGARPVRRPRKHGGHSIHGHLPDPSPCRRSRRGGGDRRARRRGVHGVGSGGHARDLRVGSGVPGHLHADYRRPPIGVGRTPGRAHRRGGHPQYARLSGLWRTTPGRGRPGDTAHGAGRRHRMDTECARLPAREEVMTMTTTPTCDSASPNDAPLLSVDGILKQYGGVTAVDEVSFAVPAGTVLGLVGPNGAGKTTLLDCIVGTQVASAGAIRVGGRAVGPGPTVRARAGLARTFQHPQLALELSPVENIVPGLVGRRLGSYAGSVRAMFRGLAGTPHGALTPSAELAAEYGVTTEDVSTGDLGLGAQRLVEIARAMASQPRVLLLDEPFAGSDRNGIAAVSRAIGQAR